MQTQTQKILLSPLFLFGLFLLILNDFFLKSYFHNFMTGKISDFAGLFVFPLFFAAFFPQRKLFIYLSTALLFVFWKSPFSQSLIDFWNSFQFFKIGRTIDYTDLSALSVLPLSYFYFKTETQKQKTFSLNLAKRILASFVVLLSVFAFTATQLVEERSFSMVKDYEVKVNRNDIEDILKKNEKITNLKIVREADFYPANTENINPNGFYAQFSFKQKICDSEYPEFHFHIQQEKKFTIIKALFVEYRCKEKSLQPHTNKTLEQYELELTPIFEREVIEKLKQNSSQ